VATAYFTPRGGFVNGDQPNDGYHRVWGRDLYRKRDVTAAGRYAAMACEPAPLHFQGSSSSILVLG
jgi:hypothetical protein